MRRFGQFALICVLSLIVGAALGFDKAYLSDIGLAPKPFVTVANALDGATQPAELIATTSKDDPSVTYDTNPRPYSGQTFATMSKQARQRVLVEADLCQRYHGHKGRPFRRVNGHVQLWSCGMTECPTCHDLFAACWVDHIDVCRHRHQLSSGLPNNTSSNRSLGDKASSAIVSFSNYAMERSRTFYASTLPTIVMPLFWGALSALVLYVVLKDLSDKEGYRLWEKRYRDTALELHGSNYREPIRLGPINIDPYDRFVYSLVAGLIVAIFIASP